MKTFLISESDVIPLIHSEYPTLSKYKLQDVQRFCSGDGRKYNVFLVHAPDSPWKQIVAKSNWHENSDLCDEVRISDYLKDTKVPAPIPLFPYKEGNSFVLLPYIDGTSAAELIQDDDKVEEVFAAIGATLKKNSTLYLSQGSENFGKTLRYNG